MSNKALLNIQHYISMESWLQSSAHTWVSCWCQLDSWTAGERGRGCWETKAAAATTPAGRHLEDNITKHTSLWGTSNRCAFYFTDSVSIFLHQRQADAIKLIKWPHWPRLCRWTGLWDRKGSGRDVSCVSPGLPLDVAFSLPSLRFFTGVALDGTLALKISLVMKPFPVGEGEPLPLPWCKWARLFSALGLRGQRMGH